MSTQFSHRDGILCVTPVLGRVLDALREHGDMEPDDLAEAAHTCCATLLGGGYLRRLVEFCLIRVSKWRRNTTGGPTPIYSVTPGASVSRPRKFTRSERTQRWAKKNAYQGDAWQRRQSLKLLVEITRRKA